MSDRAIGGTAIVGDAVPGDRAHDGTVSLKVEAQAQVDLSRVPEVLGARDWLGEELDPDERGKRRIATDLVLGVGSERPITFRRSLIVALGRPHRDPTGLTVPIEWQAAALTPLFPVFVGSVRVDLDRIAIEGHYAPPFGIFGAALDHALLGIAARATAGVILGRFVGTLARS